MAEDEKKDERPATCWYDGAPEQLAATVSKCEMALAPSRFLEGCIRRSYDGKPMLPGGHAGLGTGLDAADLLVDLEALTKENHLRAVIGAAGSMIVRKPAFRAITVAGSWKRQVSARKVSRLLNGVSQVSGFVDAGPDCWTDSTLAEVAWAVWSVEEDGRVSCERAPPHEFSWNPSEGSDPRTCFRRTGVPLRRLQAMFKDKADELEDRAPVYKPPLEFFFDDYRPIDSDLREVCIGWRKADGDDIGRVVMTCGEVVLRDEEWENDFWAAVPLKWSSSYNTFAGIPLAYELLAGQASLHRWTELIDRALQNCAIPKVLAPMNAIAYTNAIEVIPHNPALGAPQILSPPQVLPPEVYRQRDRDEASMYQRAGVSQSVAQGTRPAGINSAVGQREHRDQAATRLVLHAQRLEAWQSENLRVALSMMAAAYGSQKTRIRAPNTRLLSSIDWEGLDLKENEIEVRAYLTSAIPLEPAGRVERLGEWVEAGVLTHKRAMRYYANPDVESLEDQESALEDLVTKMVESALFDGEWIAPEPVMGPDGLALLQEVASKRLMEALVMPEPPPDANMELLRRLIEESKLVGPQPAPPAAPAPAPVAPAPAPALPAA